MALAQTYKDYFHVNPDKENSSMNANITTRKPSFLIKKNPKLGLKPIARTQQGRVHLDPIESQASQKERLNVMSQNLKELGLTKKLNAYKVKKTLVYEKDKENSKREMPDLVNYKERVIVPGRHRQSQQMAKENVKSTILPEIGAGRNSFKGMIKSENNLEQKRESIDDLDVAQDDEEDHWILVKGIPSEVSGSRTYHKDDSEIILDPKEQASLSLKEYVDDIIQTLKEREQKIWAGRCLKNHKISPALRSKMVDWMIEVMCSYKCSDFAFFLAANIMDAFFAKTDKVHTANDLHLVGVTCIFMAAKFEEIYPMRLAVVHEKIAHKKLNVNQILEKEGEILQALNYNIVSSNVYDYLTNVLYQLELKEVLGTEMNEYLHKVCVYLCKANLYDYELVSSYSNSEMAACTLFVAFKVIEQLDGSFPLSSEMERVCEILQVDSGVLYPCASKILGLAKNFETIYPHFKNLKKFHSIGTSNNNSFLEGSHNKSKNSS